MPTLAHSSAGSTLVASGGGQDVEQLRLKGSGTFDGVPRQQQTIIMPAAQQDLVDFLAMIKLSNAKKHFEGVECDMECSTLAALKGLKANDLKAMGFKPEVRSRLQKHIADDTVVGD